MSSMTGGTGEGYHTGLTANRRGLLQRPVAAAPAPGAPNGYLTARHITTLFLCLFERAKKNKKTL